MWSAFAKINYLPHINNERAQMYVLFLLFTLTYWMVQKFEIQNSGHSFTS